MIVQETCYFQLIYYVKLLLVQRASIDNVYKMRLARTLEIRYGKCFYPLLGILMILCIVNMLQRRREAKVTSMRQTLPGYVLTLRYTGQQMAGIRGLISQQCWMRAFNLPMAIVSPFLLNSHLIHSKELWVNFTRHAKQQKEIIAKAPTFDKYFDMQHFNDMSRKAGRPQLVEWNDFLEIGPKSLIILEIDNLFSRGCLVYTNEEMCKEENRDLNAKAIDEFTTGCKTFNPTSTAIDYLKSIGFQVVRRTCLNCKLFGMERSLTPSAIVKYIFGDYKPNEVTLVIDRWKFSMMMSPTCNNLQTCHADGFDTEIVPSKSILSDVTKYTNSLSLRVFPNSTPPKFTVAVMIRIEWLLISTKSSSLDIVRECLQDILKKYQSLTLSKDTDILPFLALDIGKFGSTSFNNTMEIHKIKQSYFDDITLLVKNFVFKMYKGKLNFKQWEETYEELFSSGVVVDGGYIAAVQSTLASLADCMILAGGGHFQLMAKEQYIKRNHGNTECLYQMCT